MKLLKNPQLYKTDVRYICSLSLPSSLSAKIKKYSIAVILASFVGAPPSFAYTTYTGNDPDGFMQCLVLFNGYADALQNAENNTGQGISDQDMQKIQTIAVQDASIGVSNPKKVDSIGKLPVISELAYTLYNRPFIHNCGGEDHFCPNSKALNHACMTRINEIINDPDNSQSYS
jgi:hypothetical protein